MKCTNKLIYESVFLHIILNTHKIEFKNYTSTIRKGLKI